jgi:hypothetical protein
LNIFKIRLEFGFKRTTHQDIIEGIKFAYKDRSSNKEGYSKFVQQKWGNLDHKNIKALYEPEQIIVRSHTRDNIYFIVNEEENNDKNKATLTIIIFSKENDTNKIFNDVLKDIKIKLKDRKIKYYLQSNTAIVMYLFDNKANDIVACYYVVNFKLDTFYDFNKREIFFNMLMVLFGVFLALYNEDFIMPGVKESLFASAVFFILTNIISNVNLSKRVIVKKLPELYNLNYEITSEDLEKFYSDNTSENIPKAPTVPNVPKIPIKN